MAGRKQISKGRYPKRIGSKRLNYGPESDDQFVARMKRENGTVLVENCLKQIAPHPSLDHGLDKFELIDCINREIERSRPKLKKDMKRGPGKKG
jgi:hypothetical protein